MQVSQRFFRARAELLLAVVPSAVPMKYKPSLESVNHPEVPVVIAIALSVRFGVIDMAVLETSVSPPECLLSVALSVELVLLPTNIPVVAVIGFAAFIIWQRMKSSGSADISGLLK